MSLHFDSGRCSINKGTLPDFPKFTGKYLRWSLVFTIVGGLANLLKKRFRHRSFPVNSLKFLRTLFTNYICVTASEAAGESGWSIPQLLFYVKAA